MRGGGPWSTAVTSRPVTLSPHAWGWTDVAILNEVARTVVPTCVGVDQRGEQGEQGEHVVPTCVGVDRRARRRPEPTTRCPHMRGGGPASGSSVTGFSWLSPHAWGWTGALGDDVPVGVVVPTCVGVDRLAQSARKQRPRCPHMRGGGPNIRTRCGAPEMLSPHAWGWTGPARRRSGRRWVVPTCVGVDRKGRRALFTEFCCPHMRGGGPRSDLLGSEDFRLSPHAWGWTAAPGKPHRGLTVVPTCVGVDRSVTELGVMALTLSPHAWGWTEPALGSRGTQEVVPTCVGVDRTSRSQAHPRHGCPHMRGGGP